MSERPPASIPLLPQNLDAERAFLGSYLHSPIEIHALLPQNLHAERAFLGSYLLSPIEIHALALERGLTAEMFHHPAHQLIFTALEAMTATKTGIDLVTLTNYLHDVTYLDECGGPAYVTELFTAVPTAAMAGHYIAILLQKYAARLLIATCEEFSRRARQEPDLIGELIDEAQGAILRINRPDSTGQESITHISVPLEAALAQIHEAFSHRGRLIGLPTGIHGIDRMTKGLRGPQFVVVAGRPSAGKSALLFGIADRIAVSEKKSVLIFSLEMSDTEFASRILCQHATVTLGAQGHGFLTAGQRQSLPAALTRLSAAPIYIDATPGISIQELRVRVRRHIRLHPETACVVIDYLQIMCSNTKRARENRHLEIGEITAGLKNLAREIGRPILAGAQLNRDGDTKDAPKLSHLRESGSIEQDADMVLIVHRKILHSKDPADAEQATIILAKHRNGGVGPVECVFDAPFAQFKNPDGEVLYSNDLSKRQGNLYPEENEEK